MAKKFNRERFKEFVLRRKLNAFGLLAVTLMSAIITLICALRGFARTNVLVVVTVLLVLLCLLQAIKMRKCFRTIPKFRGSRKKRNKENE